MVWEKLSWVLRGTNCVLGNVGNNHGKLGNPKNKSTILSFSHIRDMYIESDESYTIGFDKMDVDNKETIIGTCYQKPITKMTL
jgi:hypothetical protein